jgi:hypothetical protein
MTERISNADVEAQLRVIEDSLGPDPSDEEIAHAVQMAFDPIPESIRQAMLPELKRLAAVYGSVDFP